MSQSAPPTRKQNKTKPGIQSSWATRGGFVRFGRPQLKEVGGTYSVQEFRKESQGNACNSRTGKATSRETLRAYLKFSTLKGHFNHLPGSERLQASSQRKPAIPSPLLTPIPGASKSNRQRQSTRQGPLPTRGLLETGPSRGGAAREQLVAVQSRLHKYFGSRYSDS